MAPPVPLQVRSAFNSGEIGPTLLGRPDLARYANGSSTVENFLLLPQGGIVRRPGTLHLGGTRGNGAARLVPFVAAPELAYMLEFTHLGMRVWLNRGLVAGAGGQPFEIATGFALDTLPRLRFAQSHDVAYVAGGGDIRIRKLVRRSSADWDLSLFVPTDGPWLNVNPVVGRSVSVTGVVGSVLLNSPSEVFVEGHVGALWRLEERSGGIPHADWEAGKAYAIGARVKLFGRAYEALNAATSGTIGPIHERGTAYDGGGSQGVQWEYLHSGYGVVRITGFVSAKQVTAEVVRRPPDSATGAGTTYWREGAWSDRRGWPTAVAFFGGRIVYASGNLLRLDFSAVDDYENFAPDPDREDAAFSVYLDGGRASTIAWLAEHNRLFVGTDDGIWAVSGAGEGEPVSPTSIVARRVSPGGAADRGPVQLDVGVLYLSRGMERINVLGYDLARDGYLTDDLNAFAPHVLRPGVVDVAYQRNPFETLWCARADGQLATAVFDPRQETLGWARQVLAGDRAAAVAVAALPGRAAAGGSPARDEVWFVARRGPEGAETYAVEMIDGPLPEDTPIGSGLWHLVDAGLHRTFDPPVDALAGLDHLGGLTVEVVTDGAPHRPVTVAINGTLALDYPASVISVGLPFRSLARGLPLEQGAGRTVRIVDLNVRLLNSLGVEVAVEEERFAGEIPEARWREVVGRHQTYDAVPQAADGIFRLAPAGDWGYDPRVAFRVERGTPATILAYLAIGEASGF